VRLAAAVVTALALSAVAGATIVPQRGIAGLRLHMTKAQVRAVRGVPPKVQRGLNDFGVYTTYYYSRVSVTFQGDRTVTALVTRSPRERTASGVGVGSTEAQLKSRLPAARCRTESGFRHCSLGAFLPGRTVTDFVVKSGRVTRVTVGIVLD
jgi:hypothetical protein